MGGASRCGVDFGGRFMHAVQLAGDGAVTAHARVRRRDISGAPTEEDLRRLAGAMERGGVATHAVVAGVPRTMLAMATGELSSSAAALSVRRAAQTELARVGAGRREDLEVACAAMPARRGDGIEYTFCGCGHAETETFLEACAVAGLDVTHLEPATRALARRLRGAGRIAGELSVGVVLEWQVATVIVLDGDRPAFEREIPHCGLDRLIDALAARFPDTDAGELEYLLFRHGVELMTDARGAAAAIGRSLAAQTGELLGEIARTADYARTRLRRSIHGALALAGEGARVPGLAAAAAARTGMKTRRAAPRGVDPTLAISIGLAERMR